MQRCNYILIILLFFSIQTKGQPAGCVYPENGPYECKSGGVILETGHFKNGRKNGEFKRYAFGGKLLVSEHYVSDKREGETKTFYENGQLKFLRNYKNGVRISDESFWEDGRHKYKGVMDVNGRQGTHYTYHENGNLKEVKEWKDDKVQRSTNYDEEGRKIVAFEFENNVSSYMREFYPNGQVSQEGPLGENGYREGNWKVYDEAGNLRLEGKYSDGKRTGEWKGYNEKGELVQTKTFE